jgi:3-dehydroquinate synthase
MDNVVLIGMPGSGKSAVGARIGAWLGWPLLDTDDLVARRAGRPVAEIFARDGEAEFRRLEQAAVREAARAHPAVIATGGGVVLDRGNMSALRRRGFIVALQAAPEVLLARLGADGGGRPLLAPDPRSRVQTLLAERAPRYATADLSCDAARPPEDLADEVLAALTARTVEEVVVDLAPRAYAIHVGAGILDLLGWQVRRRLPEASRAVVLTHSRVRRRYGARVERTLEAAGLDPLTVTVPEGEGAKSLRTAAAVFDRMAAAGADRNSVVVGVGGGVIGDLAGFVAGTYMRGVALVHVPTTLLAQVDSAVGGKAAVNHPRAKNLVGVIHQPSFVLADVAAVRTLPEREVRSGMAEIIKYGVVCDGELLAFAEEHLDALARRQPEALRRVVRWCAAIKARVVQADEREAGPRRVLNYGHTVGHALEIAARGTLTHGEAIAAGMSAEAWIAERVGLAAPALRGRQAALLARAGLPTTLPAGPPPDEEILAAMHLDKKTQRGALNFTLPRAAGEGVVDQLIPEVLVREALQACRASS